ncbi:hypothetical protein C8F04DRAFT_1063447 [Mycena alexandri]|uniref:Uncharacterized protein n=1 Tax=Mycena alexandri TaxID=1745969 RepID=A0AAD6XDN0_9AGAR|nr:hypothetical protein C8F04DRAFT_1063447 [Mycena alexandri]
MSRPPAIHLKREERGEPFPCAPIRTAPTHAAVRRARVGSRTSSSPSPPTPPDGRARTHIPNDTITAYHATTKTTPIQNTDRELPHDPRTTSNPKNESERIPSNCNTMLDMHISLASLSSLCSSSSSSHCSPTTRGDGSVVTLAACGYLIMGAMGCVDRLGVVHHSSASSHCIVAPQNVLVPKSVSVSLLFVHLDYLLTTSPSASRPTTSIHPSYLHDLSTSTSLYDLTSLLKDVLHTSVHIYPHLRTYIFLSWSVGRTYQGAVQYSIRYWFSRPSVHFVPGSYRTYIYPSFLLT